MDVIKYLVYHWFVYNFKQMFKNSWSVKKGLLHVRIVLWTHLVSHFENQDYMGLNKIIYYNNNITDKHSAAHLYLSMCINHMYKIVHNV